MSLIYITGIAGAGKSAVCRELVKRGYDAHEGDDTLSAFYDNRSGQKVDRPRSSADRTPEWRAEHSWKMSKAALLELKANTQSKPSFVCGVASNEEEYIDVFDKVFALDVDLPIVKKRIAARTDSDFGKSDHEMRTLLDWHQTTKEHYRGIGARIIDARQPLAVVVDGIVRTLS